MRTIFIFPINLTISFQVLRHWYSCLQEATQRFSKFEHTFFWCSKNLPKKQVINLKDCIFSKEKFCSIDEITRDYKYIMHKYVIYNQYIMQKKSNQEMSNFVITNSLEKLKKKWLQNSCGYLQFEYSNDPHSMKFLELALSHYLHISDVTVSEVNGTHSPFSVNLCQYRAL